MGDRPGQIPQVGDGSSALRRLHGQRLIEQGPGCVAQRHEHAQQRRDERGAEAEAGGREHGCMVSQGTAQRSP